MNMTNDDPSLVTVDEHRAAEILGFSVAALRKRRWLREAPAFLKVGRLVRYRLSDLQAYLDSCTVAPRGREGRR